MLVVDVDRSRDWAPAQSGCRAVAHPTGTSSGRTVGLGAASRTPQVRTGPVPIAAGGGTLLRMHGLRVARRGGRVLAADVVVLTGMAAFVGTVYSVVVVGGGRLAGSPRTPSAVLSVAATALVAIGFDPLRHRLSAWTDRWAGRPSSPVRVLTRFLSGTAGQASPEDAAARMARALVDGLGAEEAEVWVVVGEHMQPAGAWPRPIGHAEPPELVRASPDGYVRAVWHGGELLGALRVRTREGAPLAPVEEQLLDRLAASAGLVLRNLALAAELQERYRVVQARADALARSRRRIVALEDEERRRLERDIHDGAQQQLVALAVNLRVARSRLARGDRGPDLISSLADAVDVAQDELLGVVSGRARLIATAGLEAALHAVADTCPVPAEVVGRRLPRYPAEVEQALYYCCAEALQNVAKHADAGRVTIELDGDARGVRAVVGDDGHGFAPDEVGDGGRGLRNIAERIAAVGGTVDIRSTRDAGTRIELAVPVTSVGDPS